MSDNGFFDSFLEAARLPWHQVPKRLHEKTVETPIEDPVPAPDESSSADTLLPADIRGTGLEEAVGGHMITRSLAGVDVTLMVVPPEGDDLWVLRGRIWLDDPEAGKATVALTQGQNVLATLDVADSEEFEFREILGSAWVLEFHLADGSVALLRGQLD